jgi:hypothetical protein
MDDKTALIRLPIFHYRKQISKKKFSHYLFIYIPILFQDFSLAKVPVKFFIHLAVFQCENHSLVNGQTNEVLVIKKAKDAILISRYPMEAQDEWVQANEQEVLDFDFNSQDRRIFFDWVKKSRKIGYQFPSFFSFPNFSSS